MASWGTPDWSGWNMRRYWPGASPMQQENRKKTGTTRKPGKIYLILLQLILA